MHTWMRYLLKTLLVQQLHEIACNLYESVVNSQLMDELQAAIDAMIWQILTDTEVYWV